MQECSGDSAHLVARKTNSLTIDANMRCRGLVVAGENYDPGWRATIDGRSAPLLEVDGIARGVVAPAGHHRIEMTFRPVSVLAGAILTGIGLLAMASLAFL